MAKITKTPFGDMIERTPEEEAALVKDPPKTTKPAPPPRDFYPVWGGKQFDKISKKIFTAEGEEIANSFTFDDTTAAGYNPLQFVTQETQDKFIKMLRKLCPGTYVMPVTVGPEVFMPCAQRSVLLNSSTHNVAAMATMIMFSGWNWFKIWMKQTMEPQGIMINMSLTEEEAFDK